MTQENFELPPLDANVQMNQRSYNMPIYGSRGVFSLSPNVSVPYCSVLLDLKRITSEIKTHEEIAPSMDNVYTLAELFQREINETRVKHEIVDGFLRAPDKIKFFNSLTVVLLPKSESGQVLEEFPSYGDDKLVFLDERFDQSFNTQSSDHSVFGGVQFSVSRAVNIARLRWDVKRVDAVAVDGQHRLKALKMWMHDKHNELTDIEKPTTISVLFLLLHSAAGFKHQSGGMGGSSIKTIAREIFTDLNKNAKEVDLATQIVLDDRNLEACCVRSLITPKTSQMSETLLPLSLLRWREANNRFDSSWYLNSLVNLHLIVEDAIGLQIPDEPMNATKVRSYIRALETALGETNSNGDKALRVDGLSLSDHYDQSYFDRTDEDALDAPVAPFSAIPTSFLGCAVEGFRRNYAPWILKILREFKPYKNVITYAVENGIVEGEFAKYLAQPQSARVELKKELEHKYQESWYEVVVGRHERAIAAIKAYRDTGLGEQWAFKTVFQKALVRLGKQIEIELPDADRKRMGADIDDMLSFFGRLYDANILRVYSTVAGLSHGLWTCVAVNPGNRKIKVTGKTEKRIEALLRVWYLGYRYKKNNLITETDWARAVYNAISVKAAQALWMCSNDVRELLAVFESEAVVLDPAALAGDFQDEKRDEIQRKIARNRLFEILKVGWDAGLGELSQIGSEALPIDDDRI